MTERAGMKNGYTCHACGKSIVTVNMHDGTTPFMISCRATPGCAGMMSSSFYTIPQDLPIDYEWFRPEPEQMDTYSPSVREHIEKGGLVLRKVAETP